MSANKFIDIDMLEIPDEGESFSSETEGFSEQSSEKGTNYEKFKRSFKNNKINLQQWLKTGEPPKFEFHKDVYQASLSDDPWSKAYSKYVNSLYKNITGLIENKDIRDDDYEAIGLITPSSDIGLNAKKKLRKEKIDISFTKLIESLETLISDCSQTDENSNNLAQDDEIEELNFLKDILEGVKANYFYVDINLKPESISKWINNYDAKPSPELIESIAINSPKPYLHPEFWNTYLSQIILRGMLTQATEAITHSQYEELEFSEPKLYNIINDFKALVANYSTMALKGQFAQWKLSCSEFRNSFPRLAEGIEATTNKMIQSQIYDLVCILTGMPKIIASFCDNWYELFCALAFFEVRDDDDLYEEYFNVAVSEKPPSIRETDSKDFFDITEKTFLDTMEGNFLNVLQTIHRLDPAMASYVSHLFEIKGYLDSYYEVAPASDSLEDVINKNNISEYFLSTHAYNCLNLHSLIPAGIGLLLNPEVAKSRDSESRNKSIIKKVLPLYEYKSNDDLEWALTICAMLDLVSTAKQLYYRQGIKSLEEGHLFESMNMFVNSYDPTSASDENNVDGFKKVHYIAWELIFQISLINNKPIEDELINSIIEHKTSSELDIHPVIQQCLSPYAVLFEFFKGLEDLDKNSFAMKKLSRLIHLLRFNHLPKKFAPLLLSQILPFLINADYKFNLPDIIVITELIGNYDSLDKSDLNEGESLYQYAINNIEEDVKPYDWRVVLKAKGYTVPPTVKQLMKDLRNEIVAKVGTIYISR